MVYVLDSPQTVALAPSVSEQSVQQGDAVVLRVARRTSRKHRRIRRDERPSGQCRVYRPPANAEREAADEVHWEVEPEHAVRFTSDPVPRLVREYGWRAGPPGAP